MRDEQRRLFFAADDAAHVAAHVEAGLVVERGKGLVEQQYVGVGGEGAYERGALAHPARKLPRVLLQKSAQPVLFGERERPRRRLRRAVSADLQRQADVPLHRPPGEQLVALQHIAELPRSPLWRRAVHEYLSPRRLQKPRGEGEQRRLAAARRPDHGDKFTLPHGKVEAVRGERLALFGVVGQAHARKFERGRVRSLVHSRIPLVKALFAQP